MKLTVAEALIKFLDNQYVSFDGVENKFVEGVFTIFGHGCVVGIGEALAKDNHTIKVYQGRNEQGMAHVAASYAKQNNRRKIIPCVSSIGPGAVNMATAAAMATVNNIPLLLFPGDTFATRQPDPVLQQVEQEHDLNITSNDVFKPIVKYWDRIVRPEQLMRAMLSAMRILTSPNTGAVCIAMPQDVQGESYDYPDEFFVKRIHKIVRQSPSASELAESVEAIQKSKKPLIIIGGGARYSEAGEVIVRFSREFNIPVSETQAGKSTVKGSYQLNLGGVGVTGNSAANSIAKDADVVIGVGTRFTDFTTASKSLFKSDVKFISINTSGFHASKMDAVSLVGDAKFSLEILYGLLKKSGYKSSYKDEISKAKNAWEQEYKRLSELSFGEGYLPENLERDERSVDEFINLYKNALTQTQALAQIRQNISSSAIVVGSSGSLPGCLQRMWKTDSLYSYNMEYGYSTMGYEVQGALGSKIAAPDREVYAMVGDGSYLMLHSEFITAVAEHKKIVVLLFDNCGFGCINNLQMGQGIKSMATEFRFRNEDTGNLDGAFIPIDYAMSARAYGAKGYTAKTKEELLSALRKSKKDTVPVLIDIKVLPKSMTHGYDAWWHVGNTSLPTTEKQKEKYSEKLEMLKKARKY